MESKAIYVDEKTVADITGMSLSRLRQDRFHCRGIPYVKNGRSVRYFVPTIHEYMDKHTVQFDDAVQAGEVR